MYSQCPRAGTAEGSATAGWPGWGRQPPGPGWHSCVWWVMTASVPSSKHNTGTNPGQCGTRSNHCMHNSDLDSISHMAILTHLYSLYARFCRTKISNLIHEPNLTLLCLWTKPQPQPYSHHNLPCYWQAWPIKIPSLISYCSLTTPCVSLIKQCGVWALIIMMQTELDRIHGWSFDEQTAK